MPRHILYVFHGRFPDPRAAAIFAAQEARSLAEFCKVTIVVPTRDTTNLAAARAQFGLPESISLIALPTIDLYRFPLIRRFSFEASLLSFTRAVQKFLKEKGTDIDWVFAVDHRIVTAAKECNKKVLFEIHDFPKHTSSWTRALRSADKILATNAWKQRELIKQFSIEPERIFLERNGVDIKAFTNTLSKDEAREKLGLHRTGSHVVYTGHLYEWKGVDTLAEAALRMPQTMFYFVGGTDFDLKRFYTLYGENGNVRMVGQRPHEEMPVWQAAADVLVLPNTARLAISEHYTSPLKLFEYMASGRPIVASALPSITEIIDDTRAYLCTPDDAEALAETIRTVLADEVGATGRAAKAREHIEQFSWNKRAKRILTQLA